MFHWIPIDVGKHKNGKALTQQSKTSTKPSNTLDVNPKTAHYMY